MPRKKVSKKVRKKVSRPKAKPVKRVVAKKPAVVKKKKGAASWILMVLGAFLILLSLLGAYPSGDYTSATVVLVIGVVLFWLGYRK